MRLVAFIVACTVLARGQVSPAARQAELAGDFAAAEKAYEEQLRTYPSADTWQRLGLIRNLQNSFDTAIPAFRAALSLDPSLWTARLFLAICLYRTNDFRSARTELESAARQAPARDPGRDEIDYWLGATLIASREPWAGLIRIEQLIARNPTRADALQLATETYANVAGSLWNKVADHHFETAAGYEVHGHALESEGNVEGALDAYRQSLKRAPQRPGPGTAAGRLLLQQGKPAEAQAVLAEELKRNPPDPRARYYAGLAAVQQGDMKGAVPLLETAMAWCGRDPEPAIALAQVYLALGVRDRAASAARKALAVSPGNAAARDLLLAAGHAQ